MALSDISTQASPFHMVLLTITLIAVIIIHPPKHHTQTKPVLH